MKGKRFTEEQIAFALRQAESGVLVVEICRKMEISEATFYRWKKKFAGMGIAELRRLKQLEEEIGGGFDTGQEHAKGWTEKSDKTSATMPHGPVS